MVTKMPRTRTATEQAVHRRDIGGDVFPHLGFDRQAFNLLTNGLGQPRRCLSGGCRQANAQGTSGLHGWRLEQGQQAHHRGGLASTRAAGNDAESTSGGQGAGQLLPVHLPRLAATVEQLRQARRQIGRGRLDLLQTLTQGAVDLPFIGPVAAQIQTLSTEHQRPRSLFDASTIGDQATAGQAL
ncbi:hypothetical protein D3C78_651620 [compost metagenome]